MRVISDLHIHSKYSRACSRDLIPQNLDKWGKIKGVNLMGTGDFTHPAWFKELKQALEPAESGFYRLKSSPPAPLPKGEGGGGPGEGGIRFVLTAEVSCIYSQGGRLRRVHHVLVLPSFAAVDKFNNALLKKGGKLASDGRPILGMNSKEVLKYLLDASPEGLMIPAHAWTPYFGIFGSKSGFDSVEECFEDMTKHIIAFETGLSSDPEMNWRVSSTDKFAIVSTSDAHSLARIGREAIAMEIPESEFNYLELYRIIKEKDKERFKFTIEYFPEEGKYHLDGHANCKVACTPAQTKKYKGECPNCGKKLVVGVVSRVADLADRPEGFVPKNAIPQKHLVPLEEVLADCLDQGSKTKKVQEIYFKLIEAAGNEFAVILDMEIGEIRAIGGELIAEAVKRVREEKVHKTPGYDGVYGVIKMFTHEEREALGGKITIKQSTLF
ncbi:MAG: endonuclease Q family protein [bacterium]|nr:endonuclease Q family protein [bacterium]